IGLEAIAVIALPQQRPRLVNAPRQSVSRDMPGWDSLQTVSAVHGAFQLAGLVLLAVLAALAAFAAYQLRGRQWPEWIDVGSLQLWRRVVAHGVLSVAVFAA